jgi:hypothetical protein
LHKQRQLIRSKKGSSIALQQDNLRARAASLLVDTEGSIPVADQLVVTQA